MVTTADDWTYIRSLLAITEQGNIAVDLVAQTLENLNIYLAGAETIPIDVVAQTLGNLAIDIKASTIGNIPINLNEQGVGDILINLNAQNIDRVEIRDHDGGAESSSNIQQTVTKVSEKIFHGVSGKGALKHVFVYTQAIANAQYLAPRIYIDGTLVEPAFHFNNWNQFGANQSSRPFQMMKYTPDGLCAGAYYYEKGLIFDSTLSLRVYNHSAINDVIAHMYWFYQKIS